MNKKNETAGKTAMQVFTYNEKDVKLRIQTIDGNPWFAVKDLCMILEHSNHKVAIQGLDEDEVRKVYLTDSLGRKQETLVTSESGMYTLIIRSNKLEAKKFRKWVTSEVLPSIRRTGRYSLPGARRSVVRMSRGEGARADMLDLLWLIGESLEKGDQAQIALELGVSRVAVNRTLNGLNRSSRILMALYKKAKENREKNLLYNNPGEMAAQLREAGRSAVAGVPQVVERVSPLPEVRIMTNKRGGQYGNQNARKHGRKEGK